MNRRAVAYQAPTSDQTRWSVVFLGFVVLLLDGFDTVVLPILVPSLAKGWSITPQAFTVALTLTNVGAVIGFFSSHMMSARLGAKNTLIGGTVVFGVFTLALIPAVAQQSLPLLTSLRLITGFGLGVVLPAAIGLATIHSSKSRHGVVSVCVTLGLATGATIAGFSARTIIAATGINGLFLIGALAPLVVASVAMFVLRVDMRPIAEAADETATPAGGGVRSLLSHDTRTRTLLLWTFAFLIFTVYYTLANWIPTLMPSFGFEPSAGPVGLGAFNLGAIAGGIILIPIVSRFGVLRPLVIMPLIAACAIAAVVLMHVPQPGVLGLLGVAGAGVVAGQIGQLTVAVLLYSAANRIAAVGSTAAMGRAGSIAGPLLGGVLLGAGLTGQQIVLTMLIPIALAVTAAAVLGAKHAVQQRGRT